MSQHYSNTLTQPLFKLANYVVITFPYPNALVYVIFFRDKKSPDASNLASKVATFKREGY